MSILITAATSAQAQHLKSVLNTVDDTLLGDYREIPDLMVKMGKMIRTPNPDTNTFVHQMLALCLDCGVTKLFPLRRTELLPLAEARQLFAEFDITLYIPSIAMLNRDVSLDITGGKIVVLENGNVIAGDLPCDLDFAGDKFPGETGIFKIVSNEYIIFTAD